MTKNAVIRLRKPDETANDGEQDSPPPVNRVLPDGNIMSSLRSLLRERLLNDLNANHPEEFSGSLSGRSFADDARLRNFPFSNEITVNVTVE